MYPLFLCACSASYWSSLASNHISMHRIHNPRSPFNYRGNLPSMRSWSFFARPRKKKWVHENVTFPSSVIPLYDLSSVVLYDLSSVELT